MKHGDPQNTPSIEALLTDDPELYLVEADMAAWMDAHPCSCDPDCDCEDCGCPCQG